MNDKSALREQVWQALQDAGAARFPGTRGRIPNFVGAEAAASRLAQIAPWQRSRRLKVNPDSPQRPVRHAALKAGKVLIMPAPKLADARPFLELDPARLGPGDLWHASSIKGASELAIRLAPDEVEALDLIVTGCVAVTTEGARLGKGGGYSDLEYAILRELGLVGPDTPIVTTVHPVQVLADGEIPMMPHDISLDAVVTPDDVHVCPRPFDRPAGVDRSLLSAEKRAAIPVL